MNKQDAHWTLDKKVPITLIFAIVAQTCVLVWFAASLTERVGVLEQKATSASTQGERLTRLEVQLEVVKDGISDIKRLLQPRR